MNLTKHHNFEAERSVVGSAIIDPGKVEIIRSSVDKNDFYNAKLRIIFETVMAMRAAGDAVDMMLVDHALTMAGHEIDYGMLAEVCNIPSAANVSAYIDIVKKLSGKRKVERLMQELSEAMQEDDEERAAELRDEISQVQTHKRKGAPVFDLEDALEKSAAMFFEQPEPIDMLFKECLPKGEPALLTGAGGTGKSRFTIQMALCAALGRPVINGAYQHLTPTRPLKVVMIGGEDYQSNYHNRLWGVMKDLNVSEDERQSLVGRLLIKSLAGEDIRIIAEDKGSAHVTNFIDRLCETLSPMGDIDLVIFDPLARFYGGNENDNHVATMFINAITQVCKRIGASPLAVHHSAKHAVGGSRGATGFVDGARTQLSLMTMAQKKANDPKRKNETITVDDHNRVVLEMPKSNHAKHWGRIVCMESTENGAFQGVEVNDDDERAIARDRARRNKNKLIGWLKELPESTVSKRQIETNKSSILWDDEPPNVRELRQMADELVYDGLLQEKDGKLHIVGKDGDVF